MVSPSSFLFSAHLSLLTPQGSRVDALMGPFEMKEPTDRNDTDLVGPRWQYPCGPNP